MEAVLATIASQSWPKGVFPVETNALKQRRLLTGRTSRVEPDGVSLRLSGLSTKSVYRIPFENIGTEPAEYTVYSKPWLWTTAILCFVSLATFVAKVAGMDVEDGAYLVWGTLAFAAALMFVLSRQTCVAYPAGDPTLVMLKDVPSAAAVSEFVAQVQERKRMYLATKYLLGSDESMAADAIHKLAWLRDQKVISEEEFRLLKADVMRQAVPSHVFPPPSDN